jgi:SAM-dependent methyltransferase
MAQNENREDVENQENNENLPTLGAFEFAMLTALAHPERRIVFKIEISGRTPPPPFEFDTRDFMSLRDEENALIAEIMEEYAEPVVLDIGCGIGRHLVGCQERNSEAKLMGVDMAPHLLEVCRQRMRGGTFDHQRFDEVPVDQMFDVVMIMGNSLGVFGNQESVRANLKNIHARLNPRGTLLVEAGPFMGRDFFVAEHVIQYDNLTDGPFPWCYASQNWLHSELEAIGFTKIETCPSSQSGPFFICRAQKAESIVSSEGDTSAVASSIHPVGGQASDGGRASQTDNNRVQNSTAKRLAERALRQSLLSKNGEDDFTVGKNVFENRENVFETLGNPEGTTGRTFFYPGAGADFEPLWRLTHLYDWFLYCDLSMNEADFCRMFPESGELQVQANHNGTRDLIRVVKRQRLDNDRLPQWDDLLIQDLSSSLRIPSGEIRERIPSDPGVQDKDDWGYRVQLSRRIGAHSREITLYYLRTEGVATYWKFFANHDAPPGGLCVHPVCCDWELEHQDSLLNRLVLSYSNKPWLKYAARNRESNCGKIWQEFREWNDIVARTTGPCPRPRKLLAGGESERLEGARTIILRNEPLTWKTVHDCDAVLISKPMKDGVSWPCGIHLVASEFHQNHRPMSEKLEHLEEYCSERRIKRLASVPFGFEDEGIVLRDWVSSSGWPEEIHFYCPTPGDYYSLAHEKLLP